MRSNKALQLTPSRHRPDFLRNRGFPFTLYSELVRPFGVAELGVSLKMQFATNGRIWHNPTMSNREVVIDLVSKLPEDTPLEDIAREIELIAGIQVARDEARRGLGISAQDARTFVETWATQ